MRSALSISAGLAVTAVVLTGLYVAYVPRPQAGRDRQPPTVVPLSQQQRTTGADGQPIRTISTRPSSGPVQANSPSSSNVVTTNPTPYAGTPSPGSSSNASVDPGKPANATSSGRLADATPIPDLRTDETANSADGPSATAVGTVDLNSASVEQFNALGAGMIGKRIVEFRPYASVDELVTKRVLKRADFDVIKASVTVR